VVLKLLRRFQRYWRCIGPEMSGMRRQVRDKSTVRSTRIRESSLWPWFIAGFIISSVLLILILGAPSLLTDPKNPDDDLIEGAALFVALFALRRAWRK